jgi:hypothetical protein
MNVADDGIGATAVPVVAPVGDAASWAPVEHAVSVPSVISAPAAKTRARLNVLITVQPPCRPVAMAGDLIKPMRSCTVKGWALRVNTGEITREQLKFADDVTDTSQIRRHRR